MYQVKVLTNNKRGSKILKKFKSYDKAKEYYNKMCEENVGAGHFIYNNEEE
jgi:pentatricopeptide repeat protein